MSSKKRNYTGLDPEIRITHVPPQLHDELINISKNLGVSLTQMLKPKLREIANSFPEHLKQPYKD